MTPPKIYYLHHSATNETSSFGPVGKFSELVEVTHGLPGKMDMVDASSKIVDITEARRIWTLLVGEGFKRHGQRPQIIFI